MASISELERDALSQLEELRKEAKTEHDAGVAGFEIRTLLAHVLGVPPNRLLSVAERELALLDTNLLFTLLKRRANGDPLQYIVGQCGFHSIELKVDPRALVPRAETELLVEAALERVKANRAITRVVDLGTGSGAVLLALASELKSVGKYEYIGVDNSSAALSLARENAERLKLLSDVQLIQGDLLESFHSASLGPETLIVANLPYIPERESLSPEVTEHEPVSALYAGADGLECYRRLLSQAVPFLKRSSYLFLEIGHGQASALDSFAQSLGLRVSLLKRDLHQIERVIEVK